MVELLALEREQAADLSHRLRTPVTALRLDVDQIDDPQVAERLRGHVDNLVRTVDQVVADARRPVRADLESRCDAAQVVRERVEFWSALAQDQDRAVGGRLDAGPLLVAVDAADLADALDALLDNVFAHTPDGTAFAVDLAAQPEGGARVEVSDAGPGFPRATSPSADAAAPARAVSAPTSPGAWRSRRAGRSSWDGRPPAGRAWCCCSAPPT